MVTSGGPGSGRWDLGAEALLPFRSGKGPGYGTRWEGPQGTPLPSGEGRAPCSGPAPTLSLCFQDCPAAEKESKVLRIVSQGLSRPWGWGGTGLRLPSILPSLCQSSHVAGICCNILSCCPEELLEQKAVLKRVPLDDPSVSPDLSPLTSGPLKQPHVGLEI